MPPTPPQWLLTFSAPFTASPPSSSASAASEAASLAEGGGGGRRERSDSFGWSGEEEEEEGGGWADGCVGVEDVGPPSITSVDFLKWREEKNESILALQLIQLLSIYRFIGLRLEREVVSLHSSPLN